MNNQDKYIHIDRDELYNMFIKENKTRKECAEFFKCSEATIKKKCRQYNISKQSKQYLENTTKKLIENHGTSELWNISNEKRKNTNIEKFGTVKPFQSDLVQDKVSISRKSKCSDEEKIIKDILIELKVDFEKEYAIKIEERNSYFDFCIFHNDDIILIEVDGIFHVKSIHGKERLGRNIKEEQKKNSYCFNNNIRLERIPYFLTTEQKINIIKNIISPD